jgi:transposase
MRILRNACMSKSERYRQHAAQCIRASKLARCESLLMGNTSYFEGLSAVKQTYVEPSRMTLRRDPHGGHLFVFRGRRGGLIKVLWHDGQGMCPFAKRLERGRFIWLLTADGVVTITLAQLGYLLEGIDWRLPQHTWRPQATG